jgi:hypothetical protein
LYHPVKKQADRQLSKPAIALAYGYHAIKILEDGLFVFSLTSLLFSLLYNFRQTARLRNGQFGAVLIFLFVSAVGLSFLYVEYAFDLQSDPKKIQWFYVALIAFGLIPAFSILREDVYKRLPEVFVFWALIMLVALILNRQSFSELGDRVIYGEESNPIAIARVFCLGIVSCLYLIYIGKYKTWILWSLIVLQFVGVSLTGSRGPLIATVAACLYISAIQYKGQMFVRIFLLLMAALLFVGASSLMELDTGLRIFDFNVEEDGRNGLFSFAMDLISNAPSGIGVGNFLYESHTYPHNIYLELVLEWGWIVGGAICLLIFLGLARVFSLGTELLFIQAVAITEVINSSLTGDVTSPRLLYSIAIAGHFSWFLLIFGSTLTNTKFKARGQWVQ